jgi:1,6-anhydro-N-acetylmuramate kinase
LLEPRVPEDPPDGLAQPLALAVLAADEVQSAQVVVAAAETVEDEVQSAQVVVAAGSLEDELHSAQVVAAAGSLEDELQSAQVVAAAVGLSVRVVYDVAVTDEVVGTSGAPSDH